MTLDTIGVQRRTSKNGKVTYDAVRRMNGKEVTFARGLPTRKAAAVAHDVGLIRLVGYRRARDHGGSLNRGLNLLRGVFKDHPDLARQVSTVLSMRVSLTLIWPLRLNLY